MEKFEILAAARHTARSVKTAMQGDAIRALVELITNCDDSYLDLEDNGLSTSGIIEITYEKDGYRCHFSVRDEAEGMSQNEIRNAFGERSYGAATSGLKEGRHRRGYFGQGAKDALGGMKNGRIKSIKDNLLTECRIYVERDVLFGEIDDTIAASDMERNQLGISNDGTIAFFTADPERTGRVPRFDTVQSEIANNYMLRKILTNPKRKVFLIDKSSGDRRRLRYKFPDGKEILDYNFIVHHMNYSDFKINMSLWRSERELS